MLAVWPSALLRFAIFRDAALAPVLFHELGHHLDATIGGPAPSGEAAADAWRDRLAGVYFRKQYWWVRPFAPVLRRLRRDLIGVESAALPDLHHRGVIGESTRRELQRQLDLEDTSLDH